MKLQETTQGSTLIIAVEGRIEIETADALLQVLLQRILAGTAQKIALNLSDVHFISSAGLRVLIQAQNKARAVSQSLIIFAMQPMVAEILQLSRIDTFIPCFATLELALAAKSLLVSESTSATTSNGITARFWGTRGSLPAPLSLKQLRDKIVAALVAGADMNLNSVERATRFVESLPFHVGGTYGGNSACVELNAQENNIVLLDMGSGARAAGQEALKRLAGRPGQFHIFMSHLHWDHIMGFPFFAPAFMPGQSIRIYGCHEQLEHAFRRQQAEPSFPVEFSKMAASIEFVRLEPEKCYDIAGYQVKAKLQIHHGDSFGYRFERNGKSLVYSTDAEHKPENVKDILAFTQFFHDADLVIFDAMYSLADSVSVREDWGHSSNVMGVEICQQARAKRLVLMHHEPANDDAALERLCHEAQRLEEITRTDQRLEIVSAYDGLEIGI